METADPRVELERLQQELSTRQSTTHFAHAAVSLMVAMIIAGASAKLFWDSVKVPYVGILAAAVAVGLAAYSVRHYRRGKRALKGEVADFERMQGLKRDLGLDDPSKLLPSR